MRRNGHTAKPARKGANSNGHVKLVQESIAELVDTPAPGAPEVVYQESSTLPLKHFRLRGHPFADSVNPELFFRTEAHEDAFLRMKQCVEDDIALGLITAVSGTGKTLLTQILLQDFDPRHFKPILILVYPGMTRTALLREVLHELEIAPPPAVRTTIHSMISAIQSEIIRLHRRGVKLVLIIDEVHFLHADSLHILRTLSNIEIPERKLVTVLLFGEDSFLQRVSQPGYRSLFSRIFERVSLRPLDQNEVEQYVKFRCLMVGAGPSLFAPEVFPRVFELTGGIPREINRICHNALSRAAKQGLTRVDLTTFGKGASA